MSPLSVSVAVHAGTGTPVVRLDGEADVTTVRALGCALDAQVARRPRLLMADLAGLSFLDCAALGIILQARARLQAAGGELVLEGASGMVARLLELTGVPAGACR